MEVRFKKLCVDAVIPRYAKAGDAGLDLCSVSHPQYSYTLPYVEYKTGLAVEIPEGYVGLLFPRSSVSNYNLTLSNSVGVLDSGYRGEICFRFRKYGSKVYSKGDRIGQLVVIPYPRIEPVESKELSESERGASGYGSSGK